MEWTTTHNNEVILHYISTLVYVRTHMKTNYGKFFYSEYSAKYPEQPINQPYDNQFIVNTTQGKDSSLASGHRPHSLSRITNGS